MNERLKNRLERARKRFNKKVNGRLVAEDGVYLMDEPEIEDLDGVVPENSIMQVLCLSNTSIKWLPNGLTIDWYLDLEGTPITQLPENLTIKGNLKLRGTNITKLPKGLKVGGYIDLIDSAITEIPEGLVVGGSLLLGGSPITKLPDNLSVGGTLNLARCQITELPNNLTVGNLYLRGVPITSIGDNLKVKESADFRDTPITSIPDSASFGWDLDLSNSAITKLPDSLSIGGVLYLDNTPIAKLPKFLKVNGGWSIYNTSITEFPDVMEMGCQFQTLNLSKIKATKLPNKLWLQGGLIILDSQLSAISEELTVSKHTVIKGSNFTSWPRRISLWGGSSIRNLDPSTYPVVHDYDKSKKTIYLDPSYKEHICIGRFRGTKQEAIARVFKKYEYGSNEAEECIAKIEQCFAMWDFKRNCFVPPSK